MERSSCSFPGSFAGHRRQFQSRPEKHNLYWIIQNDIDFVQASQYAPNGIRYETCPAGLMCQISLTKKVNK